MENQFTLAQFIEDWSKSGYGIALINNKGKIIAPYVQYEIDEPEKILIDSENNGAKILNGNYSDCTLELHSGALENRKFL